MRVGILSPSGEVRTFTERHPISLLETLVGLCASLPFRKVPKLSFVMRLTLFLHITFFTFFVPIPMNYLDTSPSMQPRVMLLLPFQFEAWHNGCTLLWSRPKEESERAIII